MIKQIIMLILIMLGMVSVVSADLTTNNELYISYDSDNVSGSTVLDSSTNDFDGTCTNMASGCNSVSGLLEEASNFDGTNDHIIFSDSGMTTWLNTFDTIDKSWSYWINPDTISTVDTISFMADTDQTPRINLGDFASGTFRFEVQSDSGTQNLVSWTHNINTSEWTYIVGTWDESSGLLSMYINGNFKKSTTLDVGTISQFSASEPFTIGARNTAGTVDHYFDGKIDEFSLYNKILNTTEISQSYNNHDGFNPYKVTTPQIQINISDNQFFNHTPINVSMNTTTNVNMSIEINGLLNQTFLNTNSTSALIELSEGNNNLSFKSEDNIGVSWNNITVILDTIAPVITQISNVSEGAFEVNFSNIINVTDLNLDTCFINITELENVTTPDNFIINCTDTQTFTSAGIHNAFVTATDLASNQATYSFNFTIIPFVIINWQNNSNDFLYNYTVTIIHPDSRIEIRDDTNGNITLSPVNNGTLDLGNHTLMLDKDGYVIQSYIVDIQEDSGGTIVTFNATEAQIMFEIYDRDTSNYVTDLVTINVIGDQGSFTLNTSNGTVTTQALLGGSYQAIFSSPAYATERRFFDFDGQELLMIDAFMVKNTTDSGLITIRIKDDFEKLLPNILVKLLEYNTNTNSFIDVSQAITNLNGEAIFNIQLSTKLYIFRAVDGENVAQSSDVGEIVFTSGEIRTLILRAADLEQIPNLDEFTFTISEDQAQRVINISDITITWNDERGTVQEICINYYKKTQVTRTLLSSTCEQTSSGIINTIFLVNTTFDTVAEVTADIDGVITVLDSFSYKAELSIESIFESLSIADYIIVPLLTLVIFIGIATDILQISILGTMGISWWFVRIFPSYFSGTIATFITIICLGMLYAEARAK